MTFDEQVAVRTLAQEARGEPRDGQLAVAHVLLNRVKDGRWGKTLASVCLWHGQFSGWWSPRGKPAKLDPNFEYACTVADDDITLIRMLAVLNEARTGADFTNGANHYFADSIAPPPWAASMTFRTKIGHHLFYTDKPTPSGTGLKTGV